MNFFVYICPIWTKFVKKLDEICLANLDEMYQKIWMNFVKKFG